MNNIWRNDINRQHFHHPTQDLYEAFAHDKTESRSYRENPKPERDAEKSVNYIHGNMIIDAGDAL